MTKSTKKGVIKRKMKFQDYKNLENNKTILKSCQRFRSEIHNVFTEKVNKIALSTSDEKRLLTFVRVISYPYGTFAGRVSSSELIEHVRMKN